METSQRFSEELIRDLIEAELRYYGYTDDQIALTRLESPHTDQCEFEGNSYHWQCEDENGKSSHPEWDEANEIGGVIVRALDNLPSLAGLATGAL